MIVDAAPDPDIVDVKPDAKASFVALLQDVARTLNGDVSLAV